MRSLARLRLLAGLLLCLALAPVQAAFAHAQLLSTNPAENAVLQAAPSQIDLNFNEPVTPLTINLIGPEGSATELTQQTIGGATTTVSLPSEIATGTHVLSWRVVSTDGHPIGGSLIFSIGAVTGAVAVDAASDPAVSTLLWASKALLFVALFVGVGGAAFRVIAQVPATPRSSALALSIAGIVVAPVTLGLQGLDALGLSMGSALDGMAWGTGLSTSYGATVTAALVAFILAVVALIGKGRTAGIIGLVAATIAALSLALSGHASAAEPQWLTRPAVFLHIAGVIFWVGALLPLWQLLREKGEASVLV